MGLTQSGFDPASRFRFIQFIPHLEKEGWQVEHRRNRPDRQWQSRLPWRTARAVHYRLGRAVMKLNRLRDLLESPRYDVLFVNRDFASESALTQKLSLPIIRRAVYDFDDAIFVGRNERQVRWMCEHACWVTPGNEYLARYARQFTDNVTVIPTVIDTDQYVPRSRSLHPHRGPVRVGWSGSDQSIRATLFPHLPMLAELQRRVDFDLVVVTNSRPELPVPGLRWTFHPWRQEEEPFLESKFDIGIMPLVEDEFQKGKCALKLLQYMAAGLPTVASPVGVNKDIIRHGVNGMSATSPGEWHQALESLIQNPGLRASLGCAGRVQCEKEFSIRRWLPVLIRIFETVCEETGRNRKASPVSGKLAGAPR